jgi:hypothetical protein
VFHYADSLRDLHQYRLASVEYERVIFLHPEGEVAARAQLRKAGCEKMLGLYDQAATGLESVDVQQLADPGLRYRILFEGMVTAYLAHEPARALARQAVIVHDYPDSARSRDLMLLEILSLNEMQRWHEADTAYRRYMQLWRGGYDPARSPYAHIPKLKNPDKAENLSAFLPFTGAGLFYAGDAPEAILNMALQVGFIAFGAYSVLMERYITGILVGVGGYAAFYHGGVRRARHVAEMHNERASLRFNTLVRDGLMGVRTPGKDSSGKRK